MADGTKISWSDATWSPITGCSIKSPGCTHCYAMRLAGTRLAHHPSRAGLTREVNGNHVWTGEVRFNEGWLDQPLRWRRPRMIFVVAHGDLFHEDVPDEWIDRVFAVMALCPHHVFQVLTKRSSRMIEYVSGMWARREALGNLMGQVGGPERNGWYAPEAYGGRSWTGMHTPLPHVWMGVSVERQVEADIRCVDLAAVAMDGWNTFCSYEPALGAVDWNGWEFLSWMISGGENGPRPSHPNWHRTTRDWCAAHYVPYHFKQWGSWAIDTSGGVMPENDPDQAWLGKNGKLYRPSAPQGQDCWAMIRVGKKAAGRLLDGREHNATPFATEA